MTTKPNWTRPNCKLQYSSWSFELLTSLAPYWLHWLDEPTSSRFSDPKPTSSRSTQTDLTRWADLALAQSDSAITRQIQSGGHSKIISSPIRAIFEMLVMWDGGNLEFVVGILVKLGENKDLEKEKDMITNRNSNLGFTTWFDSIHEIKSKPYKFP